MLRWTQGDGGNRGQLHLDVASHAVLRHKINITLLEWLVQLAVVVKVKYVVYYVELKSMERDRKGRGMEEM